MSKKPRTPWPDLRDPPSIRRHRPGAGGASPPSWCRLLPVVLAVLLVGCARGRRQDEPPPAPLALSLAPAVASAPQPRPQYRTERATNVLLQQNASLGFTLDPDTFLLAVSTDIFAIRNLAFGPLLQVGVADRDFLFAPTVGVKGVFPLAASEPLRRIRPSLQGGLGFVYLEDDRLRGDDDDVGFMFNLGGGVDVAITDEFAVGTHVLFNIIPDKVLDENFFFSWQLATFSFSF